MKDRLPISPAERAPILDARREAKMTSSAHAYVRGSTKRFYEWLEGSKGSLPEAPSIWIGGDCHVGNLGPVAAKDGTISIELRDLDQTVVGSPAHDVLRLALSMAMAVRASGRPGAVTARVIESIARGYEVVLEAKASQREFVLQKPPEQVMNVLREARSRSRKQLFAERIGKDAGKIPMGKRFWPLTPGERQAVDELVASAEARKLVTSLTSRDDDAPVEVVDAAYWVKGCSSLGNWRGAALVRIGESGTKSSALALIDIKQALPALAPRAEEVDPMGHHGERVVRGARALSPALGERMVSARVLEHDVFIRELLPQDLKFELDSMGEIESKEIGAYLASVVAVAHARQLDAGACGTWLESFRRESAKNMSAPGWLWSSIVDLVGSHEAAYLEHCREHALSGPAPSPLATDAVETHHVTGD